jgi:hypothetical protein
MSETCNCKYFSELANFSDLPHGTVHDGGLNAANYTPFFLHNSVANPDVANT